MQNAKCRMQNYGIPYGMIEKVREADTIILHFAF